MRNGIFVLLFGFLVVLVSLLNLPFPGALLFPGGILLIIGGVYVNKGYRNKTYFFASFTTYALAGSILAYTYLFIPLGDGINKFYLFIGIYAITVLFYIRSYLRRDKDFIMPWKDEW